MNVGIEATRMSVTRRLNAHRALSLTLSFLALAGCGTFAWVKARLCWKRESGEFCLSG